MYLEPRDRALLDQAAKASGESRAEIIRYGIRRVSAELLGEQHPLLVFMREMQALDWPDEAKPEGVDPQEWFESELEKSILDDHEPPK